MPPLLPLGLPPCVLHVLHVLQIPRDRLWAWIQDDETTESSGEEELLDEEEEAAKEEEDEEDEEGSDAGSAIKEEEDEPSLAQRALRSTHLEVACMAAQAKPKGTPVKAKPEAKLEPEELSKKKKEKAKSPPKNVPFVNRPFESEIHGTVNFTYFCCFLLVTWCHCVLLSCYLRPK